VRISRHALASGSFGDGESRALSARRLIKNSEQAVKQAMMKAFNSPVVEAWRRKLTRSLAQRGMLRTLQRCVGKPWEALRGGVRDLLPRERRFRAEEREFDRRHQVQTCVHRDLGWMARIVSPNWVYGIGYAPVPARDVREVLAGLEIDFHRFGFVDFGAGKGRAMFVAAEFPFKRIVGVEYSPALVDVLTRNIASYHNPQRRCFDLRGILMDATQYVLPCDPLVIFFHHPFEAPVFRQVVERIEASWAAHSREMLVVYYDPQCKSVLEERRGFQRLKEGSFRGRCAASGDWVVYRMGLEESALA
jgi:hypothetical protein